MSIGSTGGAERYRVVGGNFFLTLAFGVLLGIVVQAAFCVVGCCCGSCEVPHKHGGGGGGIHRDGGRLISPGPNP